MTSQSKNTIINLLNDLNKDFYDHRYLINNIIVRLVKINKFLKKEKLTTQRLNELEETLCNLPSTSVFEEYNPKSKKNEIKALKIRDEAIEILQGIIFNS